MGEGEGYRDSEECRTSNSGADGWRRLAITEPTHYLQVLAVFGVAGEADKDDPDDAHDDTHNHFRPEPVKVEGLDCANAYECANGDGGPECQISSEFLISALHVSPPVN
ncbi:MAG: hypothetical protein Q7S37_01840 [bacterium]|nr:hypothetical protein [bacterium]